MKRTVWALATIGAGLTLSGPAETAPASPFRGDADGVLIGTATLGGGDSVAVSGDGRAIVVGAVPPNGRGAASVYSRTGSQWRLIARLTSARKPEGAMFGSSVGISANGRTVLVGGPGADGGKGAAWVYTAGGGGVWVGSRLPVSGASGDAGAGTSVSLSADGRNAIVGGPQDAEGKGAIWFFRKSGSSWRRVGAKVSASDAKGKSRFGSSVAIGYEGDSAIVGGPGDLRDRGAVWIWVRRGSAWKRQATIRPSLAERTKFGSGVSMSADGYTAVVGSPSAKSFGSENVPSGRAWILKRTGSSWKTSSLGANRPPSIESGERIQRFGRSVAMAPDGVTAVVGGGIGNRNDVLVRGGAWIAQQRGGTWTTGEPFEGGPSFGTYVAASYRADIVAVGSEQRVSVFSPAPLATKVEPAAGSTAGGTDVTVTGVNLANVRRVTFGATPARSFAVVSPTTVRAVSPAGAPGTVHVRVTNPYGTTPERNPGFFGGPSTRFTYYAAPTVTGVSPAAGPVAGGTQVTITGTDLYASAVRFGGSDATSFTVRSATEITAVSPPGAAGTVNVTVVTPYGTSATNEAARFTYVSPATVIGFDNLTTGGAGQALTTVTTQYADQGVTFNSPRAIDYSKGSAIPGFARSGSVAIEQCVGVELCTTPIRGTFSPTKSMIRVWVGFSFQLNQPLQVQLRAINGTGGVLGTASATLPARPTPTPISIPLEVRVDGIAQFEVLVPGGFNNALAVDDVTFES